MFRIEYTESPALTQAFSEASSRRGRYGTARGSFHEKRFIEVVTKHFRAKWFRGISVATDEEDQRGIDAVIHTTIGPLYAQVKSSPRCMRRFCRKKRKARITVILVNERLSDEELARAINRKLGALFHHINQLRGNRRAKIKNAMSV